mgnify:CR=1 FL=1
MTTVQARPDTERRRERRERQRDATAAPMMQQITYQTPRYELVDRAALQRIHDQSMKVLGELGIDFYDEEVDEAVNNMTEMIEPAMMCFLGVVVGGLVIAMYMPIFSMAGGVQ